MTFDLEKARACAAFVEPKEAFLEALAEIERLRAENAWLKSDREFQSEEQAARISDLEIEITGLKADLEQSEEIKRLKDELENYGDHYACLLISKDAQIKELEDAHKRSGAKYAKIINELRSSVYANIPGLDVGKIGPDAKPRVWQITEERIGLLEYCLETLLDAPDIEEIPGPGHSIEMLRAMLREAEQ